MRARAEGRCALGIGQPDVLARGAGGPRRPAARDLRQQVAGA